jgi:hypothetical protein
MSGKTNGVSLIVSDNGISINADVEFQIEERGDIPAAHISDVIYQLILEGLRTHEKAALGPGSYKAMLTFATTAMAKPSVEAISEEELASLATTVEGEAGALVDEMLGNEVPEPDDK